MRSRDDRPGGRLGPEDAAVGRLREGLHSLSRSFATSERRDLTACCGMTPTQAATLEVLEREGPMRLGELADRLAIDPSTLTRKIARLEHHGLVRRAPDARDSRAALVSLSRAGRMIARRLGTLEDEFALDILRRLPEERREPTLAGLADLVQALRETTEACCPAEPAGAAEQCAPWGHPPRAQRPPRTGAARGRRAG